MVVIADDLYETEGYFKFALTTIKQAQKPSISDFLNTTFDYCKWCDSKRGKDCQTPLIDSYVVHYTSKKKRLIFFEGLEEFFTFVGTIKPFERGFNSSYMSIDYFPEQETFAEALSNEMEFSQSQERRQIHLDAYKEDLKPDTVKLKDFYFLLKEL